MDMAISNINPAGQSVPAISLQGSVSGNNPPQEEPSAQASEESRPMSAEAVNQMLQQIQKPASIHEYQCKLLNIREEK